MKTSTLRRLYLDYFKSKGHEVFASDSLIPQNDPSLLFTGAGMNQFKAYFLGEKTGLKKAASCQKCFRTGDLERVGETAYHHTFFEMLGNFSFGDYFKEEAIQYGWEFVTRELKFPKEKLWVSVFEEDDEAFDLWKRKIGLPESRIVRMSALDNFWPSNAPQDGPNGPCGPCSEIYVGKKPGEGVEIWNLVFTQYDRQEGGLLKPLPQKNIDTGMGLERLASVMQGVSSNFDIDIFVELAQSLSEKIGPRFSLPENIKLRNALLDHIRAVTMTLSDGVTPSNEGRGYVIRKIIRKSVMHLKELKVEGPLFYEFVKPACQIMSDAYPELLARRDGVATVVKKEEESFWQILDSRVPQAEIKIKSVALTAGRDDTQASRRATEIAFDFYDTHGVPRDILERIVASNGLKFAGSVFEELLEDQRNRSRAFSNISASIFGPSKDRILKHWPAETRFAGYEKGKSSARIEALIVDGKEAHRLEKGQRGIVILDVTPFYAEQGGQVGDQGTLKSLSHSANARVADCQWMDGWVLHEAQVEEGVLSVHDSVEAVVDMRRRERIMKNHSATHLLHSALRKTLGPHVKQSGSLVAPDRLRFDFTHFGPLTPAEIHRVETQVNDEIRKSSQVLTRVMPTQEAMAEGAMAFFGEKYGSEVRVVSMADFSLELCGGTHVRNTQDIGFFRITSEGSIQSGVRRIEAVTADAAFAKKAEDDLEVKIIQEYLKADANGIRPALAESLQRVKATQRSLREGLNRNLLNAIEKTESSAPPFGGIHLIARSLPAVEPEILRDLADRLRRGPIDRVILLGTVYNRKPQFALAVSAAAAAKGLAAHTIVKEIAQAVGGSGGGKPDLALGGGKEGEDVEKAMQMGKQILTGKLNA